MTQLPLPLALAELPATPPTPPAPRPARSYTVTFDTITPGEGDDYMAAGDYETESGFEVERTPVEPDEFDIEDVLDSWTTARDAVTRHTLACPDWTPLAGPPSREACESAAAVLLAVKVLRDRGCTEDGGGGTSWYSADGEVDYRTGETTTYAVHLDGFTPDEINAIQSAVRAPRGGR